MEGRQGDVGTSTTRIHIVFVPVVSSLVLWSGEDGKDGVGWGWVVVVGGMMGWGDLITKPCASIQLTWSDVA